MAMFPIQIWAVYCLRIIFKSEVVKSTLILREEFKILWNKKLQEANF